MTLESLLDFDIDQSSMFEGRTALDLKDAKKARARARWKDRFDNDPEFKEQHRERTKKACAKWRILNPIKVREKAKSSYHKNPEKAAGFNKVWQEVPANRISVLIRTRIVQAKKKNVEYDEDALRALVDRPSECCEICLTRLNYSHGVGKQPNGPSIDRVVASKGYVAGNLAIVCNRCNEMKGNASADQHRMIAKFMDRHDRG